MAKSSKSIKSVLDEMVQDLNEASISHAKAVRTLNNLDVQVGEEIRFAGNQIFSGDHTFDAYKTREGEIERVANWIAGREKYIAEKKQAIICMCCELGFLLKAVVTKLQFDGQELICFQYSISYDAQGNRTAIEMLV